MKSLSTRLSLLALVFWLIPDVGISATAPAAWDQLLAKTPWSSKEMQGESLFFVQEEGKRPASQLLFVPTKTPVLKNSRGTITYESGRDFTWTKNSRTIELPEGSRIPFKKVSEFYPPKGSPNSIGPWKKDTTKNLFFGEGFVFHDLQAVADYKHKGETFAFKPTSGKKNLPLTMARLKSHQPVKIVCLGDSISAGANASAPSQVPPFQPAYPELFTLGLQAKFKTPVTMKNLAVGGMATPWGVTKVPDILAEKPNLVILAFGMNDAGGLTPQQYRDNTQKMIDGIRQASPETEIILVATMLGNADWAVLRADLFPQFEAELIKMEGPGIAVANVTDLWRKLLERKSFADLTGNGVNHPNDFGHRLYAQVLMGVFD